MWMKQSVKFQSKALMQQIRNIYRPTTHSNMRQFLDVQNVIKLLLFIIMYRTECIIKDHYAMTAEYKNEKI